MPTSAPAALGVPATPSSARAAARNPRLGRTAALVAAVLGLGNAAVSAYWLAGGTALLDTIGGDIEEWGRARPWTALVVIAVVVVVKTVVALAAPAYAALGRGRLADRAADAARRPAARALGWIAAGVLTCYGAVLTVAGLLMQAGVLEASADADDRVLAWHTYLWDPWFLAWGLALGVTLAATRRPTTRRGAGGSATSAR